MITVLTAGIFELIIFAVCSRARRLCQNLIATFNAFTLRGDHPAIPLLVQLCGVLRRQCYPGHRNALNSESLAQYSQCQRAGHLSALVICYGSYMTEIFPPVSKASTKAR
jgi:hypothetical protein